MRSLIIESLSEIIAFIIGTFVGGILTRTLPDILQEQFLGPKIKIIDIKCELNNDEYIYYAIIKNAGRKKATNCTVALNFTGQGKLSHHDRPKEGKINIKQWEVLWENGNQSVNIKRGNERRAELMKITKDDRKRDVCLNSSEGYVGPYKILTVNHKQRGTSDIRDFQSLDWSRKEIQAVSDKKEDKIDLSILPWDDPGEDMSITKWWS